MAKPKYGPAKLRETPGQRPGLEETLMATAVLWSERSTCPKRSVGAVLATWDGRVLATGYNGAPRGVKHCLDDGCELDGSGDCRRAVHAEANAIAICARSGVKTSGTTMYVTDYPCHRCAQLLATAGVERIVYGRARSAQDAVWALSNEILGAAGILATRFAVDDVEDTDEEA